MLQARSMKKVAKGSKRSKRVDLIEVGRLIRSIETIPLATKRQDNLFTQHFS